MQIYEPIYRMGPVGFEPFYKLGPATFKLIYTLTNLMMDLYQHGLVESNTDSGSEIII
ncbi:MAG: hypothetical protein ACR2F1_03835 [Nitrososphaeraceae archaeon]